MESKPGADAEGNMPPVDVPSRSLELADGRTMSYGAFGEPSGVPVLFFHGTPGSHMEGVLLHDAAVRAGVLLLAPDRPGMGASTIQRNRTLEDWPADVAAFTRKLGIGRLRIIGYSGGGPYALVCAWQMPDRVDAVSVVSGCAPADRPAGMSGSSLLDRMLSTMSTRALPLAKVTLGAMALGARLAPRAAAALEWTELTTRERAAMSALIQPSREVQADFRESTRQGALGAAVDYRTTAQPWGFLPEEIEVSVAFWHGAEDSVVPLHQAQDLANRVPSATLTVVPGASHLAIRVAADEILAQIVSG